MCYNPIDIVNPSKYVNIHYKDRYIIQVPCGKCAACRTAKSNEWSYRLYHHALDTFNDGGFVLFDTLTYDNQHLPHISDYFNVDKSVDYPCFSSSDLRKFVAALRQRCKRKFASNFSYFIASEYGTSERHLHRPHYHVLFFVRGKIAPLEFSTLVADTWSRGRTDGYPFQSPAHVADNTFRDMSAGTLRSLKYVCKYIQKNSFFEKNINARLDSIMDNISNRFSKIVDGWSASSHYWRLRELISRKISQFHRQSTFLGASVLSELDINEIMNKGSLSMPDNLSVIKTIPLPTYFKRKLFYELLNVHGSNIWIPNDLGMQYLKIRESDRIKQLKLEFSAMSAQLKEIFPLDKLADYVVNIRGRFRGLRPSTFDERYNATHYNYANRYDKEWFSRCGVSNRFCGNSSIGYSRSKPIFQSLSQFISQNVVFNKEYDDILSCFYEFRKNMDRGKQKLYEYKQHLANLVHHYFCSS